MHRPANHELLSPIPYASYSPRGLKLKIAVVLFMLAAGLALSYYGHTVLRETASEWLLLIYPSAAALPALALFDLWRYRWRWLVLLRKMASPLAHQLPPRQPPRHSLRCAANLTRGQWVSLIFLLAVLGIIFSPDLLPPSFLLLLLGLILLLRWLWGPRMARCPWVLRVWITLSTLSNSFLLSPAFLPLLLGLTLLLRWLWGPRMAQWPWVLRVLRVLLSLLLVALAWGLPLLMPWPLMMLFYEPIRIIWVLLLILLVSPLALLLWPLLLIWLTLRLFYAKCWHRWRYDAARDTFHRDGRGWPQWREEGSWSAAECCGLYLERVGRRPRLWLAGPAGGEDVLLGDLSYLSSGGKEAGQNLLTRLSAASGLPVLYRWPAPPLGLASPSGPTP